MRYNDMKLTIHLFAGLSEIFNNNQIQMETDTDAITVIQLKEMIMQQYPLAKDQVQQAFVAKNHAYAGSDETLQESDEIALIPPVSGGQGDDPQELFELTHKTIDIDEVTRKVIHPNHGASIAFIGTTREFTHGKKTVLLEYEAYIPMALNALKQIGEEISARWEGTLTAISHRLGKVEISEISVVIAVSSPHRADCYDASRYAIERLKQIVPIWKKEIWEDGSEWKGHQLGPWNPIQPLNHDYK